jgi:hypothetical protein
MKRLLSVLFFIAIFGCAQAQEFKPYPRANISEAQWQQYFEEVSQKYGPTAQDLGEQKMVLYKDEVSNTFYAFTKPGHPAHPAWIARKLEPRGNSLGIAQIGYFAGAEPPFAKLFREFSALNEKLKEDANRKQSAPELKGKLEHFIASSNVDKAWSPSGEQKEALESSVSNYFALVDKGQVDALYELFTQNVKQMMSRGQFEQIHASGLTGSGALNSRQLLKVTWYKDAQGYSGVFAAVDYNTNFENFALHCGYVVFAEQAKGQYLVMRSEANKIEKTVALRMSEEQRQNTRKAFRC